MRKETRFLLCGMFAGISLGIVVGLAIQHGQRELRPTARATTVNHIPTTNGGVTTAPLQTQTEMDGIVTQSHESVTIQISSSSSANFSIPLVKALRELKAGGESQDVLVNLVVSEFNRQWREQMKIMQQKRRTGEIDNEESQEFFSGHEDAIGKTVAELLGQDSFVYWDKHRLLRKGGATGYKLTETESDELYRIEKEHEDRKIELNGARNVGDIDPLDFEEQNRKSEERYQQLRAKLLTQDRRLHEEGVTIDLRTQIKEQTRQLNLSPQEVDALADVAFKNMQASQEMEAADTNLAIRIENEETGEAATEREWARILGPQRFAELKKMNDNRYQDMKHYQKVWQLSDNDVNSLYEMFAKYDKAIQEHRKQIAPAPTNGEAQGEEQPARIDNYEHGLAQELEAELQRFLGEERFRRFKAAGLAPQD